MKRIKAILEIDENNEHIVENGFENEMEWVEESGIKLLSYEEIGDPKKKNLLGFCPDCGSPIYDFYVGKNENDYGETTYVCNTCNCEYKHIITPLFEVGEKVYWIDVCQEPNKTNKEYKKRCNEERTITGILRCEMDNCEYNIIYELDNGTEVYEEELISVID